MSLNNSGDMQPEIDFTGGVRGKNLARYQRWAGITSAAGSVAVGATTSSGEPSRAKVVGTPSQVVHVNSRVRSVGHSIMAENLTAAHAV